MWQLGQRISHWKRIYQEYLPAGGNRLQSIPEGLVHWLNQLTNSIQTKTKSSRAWIFAKVTPPYNSDSEHKGNLTQIRFIWKIELANMPLCLIYSQPLNNIWSSRSTVLSGQGVKIGAIQKINLAVVDMDTFLLGTSLWKVCDPLFQPYGVVAPIAMSDDSTDNSSDPD